MAYAVASWLKWSFLRSPATFTQTTCTGCALYYTILYVSAAAAGALKQQLPSLGTTPGADRVLNNGASLWNWLQSIPLAASAAKDAYRGGEQLYAPRLQIQPQL
jgi:hypothetical protein